MVGWYVIHSIGFHTVCFVTVFAIFSFDRHFCFQLSLFVSQFNTNFRTNFPVRSCLTLNGFLSSSGKILYPVSNPQANEKIKEKSHSHLVTEKCSTESMLCIRCVYDLLNVYAYVIRYFYV